MDQVWSIGVDVGTSSVRACVTDQEGTVIHSGSSFLTRKHHLEHHEFITQSSDEIWNLVKNSIASSLEGIGPNIAKIRGIGVDATCSLVVLQKKAGKLVPYPVDFEFQDPDQNVVLWMDHRCAKELEELNEICKNEKFMSKIGGCFLPEMGVPKLKYLIDRIDKDVVSSLVFMELHDYVSIMLKTDGCLDLYNVQYHTEDHLLADIALDGSTKGWSSRLLNKFGLSALSLDNFQLIGRPESSEAQDYLPVPFSGARVGIVCDSVKTRLGLPSDKDIFIGHGVIDCYAGWISTVKDVNTTISMVAGTSTCYLMSNDQEREVIAGVWGPFNNFVRDTFISELGLSATGALIEHLFKTHPLFKELEKQCHLEKISVYDKLDEIIQFMSKEARYPIANYLVRHRFLYGEIMGNRTPYSDSRMTGLFIGETADSSVKDLLLKYLVTLEFLALQTTQIVSTFKEGGYDVQQISTSGSQFSNKRLVEMIEALTKLPVVSYESQEPLYTVVRGASMIGFAAALNKDIKEIMSSMNVPRRVSKLIPDPLLVAFLDAKYKIMLQMAESQIKYREFMDSQLQGFNDL